MSYTRKKSLFIIVVPVAFLATGILFSGCVNDLEAIEKIAFDPNAPEEVTKNLKIFYTDDGLRQIGLQAQLAETFRIPDHHTKFSEGLRVDFYSEEGSITSTLTALYGEYNYTTGKVFVRDSVVMHNYEKKQTLETEELFWNQRDSTIFTDKYVLIKTTGKGITGRGKGLKTSQYFDRYIILEPVGIVNLED